MINSDKRRKQRHLFDCQVELTWHDAGGHSRTIAVHAIDLSNSGIRVESGLPIDLHTSVFARAERYGLTGTTLVRHCSRRGSKYILGLEFQNQAKPEEPQEAGPFMDYYEVLQISPNAEPDTIHRVFRIMAARYHPDNSQTGDNEKFLLLTRAYETLSDPSRRASYDQAHRHRHVEPMPVFELKEFAEGVEGEANRRLGILSLLYNRRRSNPADPGLSLLEFETLMSFPREHLEFAVWYLHEKQYLRTGDNSDYTITAAGAEYLESALPANEVLRKLLHAAAPAAGQPAEPAHGPALVRVRGGE